MSPSCYSHEQVTPTPSVSMTTDLAPVLPVSLRYQCLFCYLSNVKDLSLSLQSAVSVTGEFCCGQIILSISLAAEMLATLFWLIGGSRYSCACEFISRTTTQTTINLSWTTFAGNTQCRTEKKKEKKGGGDQCTIFLVVFVVPLLWCLFLFVVVII